MRPPLSYLTRTWSWREEFSVSYLLETVKNRALLQARMDAQTRRDDRRSRVETSPWTDVTLTFATGVLDSSTGPLHFSVL